MFKQRGGFVQPSTAGASDVFLWSNYEGKVLSQRLDECHAIILLVPVLVFGLQS